MGAKLRRWTKIIGALVLLAVVGWLARHQILQFAGDFLVRDDVAAPPASYALLLMGDPSGTRADKALALYRDHQAQKIIVAQTRKYGWVKKGIIESESVINARYLVAQGVAPADVVLLDTCNNVSTYDEALCMRDYLRRQGNVGHVRVVTSWYHTSRAGWLFDQVLSPIQVDVASASGPESSPVGYWKNRDDTIMVIQEYLKWAYWRLRPTNWES